MKKVYLAIASAFFLATSGSATATTSTSTAQAVQMQVNATCTISLSMPTVTIPATNAGVAPATDSVSAGNITATCAGLATGGPTLRIAVDGGLHSTSSPYLHRRMANGSSYIGYTVSLDGSTTDIGTTGITSIGGGVAFAAPMATPATPSATGFTQAMQINVLSTETPTVAGNHTDTILYYVEF